MIRVLSVLVMMVATVAAMNSVLAEESEKECPISAAMKNLPQITYQVGEEQTHCRNSAGKLAEESGSSIVYLVGKEKFEDASEAKLALVTATEEFVAAFAEPKTCKVSGTISIAGQKTHCSESAGNLASLLATSMKGVQQTFLVGDEQCECPHAAAALAEKSGLPTLCVVGKEKTECSVTARLNLARARYRAMVEALAATADEQTETTETDS